MRAALINVLGLVAALHVECLVSVAVAMATTNHRQQTVLCSGNFANQWLLV